jgi:hypothetical protein
MVAVCLQLRFLQESVKLADELISHAARRDRSLIHILLPRFPPGSNMGAILLKAGAKLEDFAVEKTAASREVSPRKTKKRPRKK